MISSKLTSQYYGNIGVIFGQVLRTSSYHLRDLMTRKTIISQRIPDENIVLLVGMRPEDRKIVLAPVRATLHAAMSAAGLCCCCWMRRSPPTLPLLFTRAKYKKYNNW